VKYFETYNDVKYIYLVMEYIQGMPLFEKITNTRNQSFSEVQACKYLKQIVSAIRHCHALNIVHRDIKPENIMITDMDTIRLIDFGLCSLNQSERSESVVAGTPYYMAPETIDGKNCDPKADMWSLGVLLYIMMSGYLPF
jgi:serine/threonine protein kinase